VLLSTNRHQSQLSENGQVVRESVLFQPNPLCQLIHRNLISCGQITQDQKPFIVAHSCENIHSRFQVRYQLLRCQNRLALGFRGTRTAASVAVDREGFPTAFAMAKMFRRCAGSILYVLGYLIQHPQRGTLFRTLHQALTEGCRLKRRESDRRFADAIFG